MEAPRNTSTPTVKVYASKTPLGNWLIKADVNGEFYSSSSCRRKGDAKAHVKRDLSEKGFPMPAELIYLWKDQPPKALPLSAD